MAQKRSTTTVRRITATDDAPKKAVTKKATTRPAATVERTGLFASIIGYFKGAWQELKLVRWPTRAATWKMTAAVLIFTGLFAVLILVADVIFNWAFEQILR